MGGIGNFTAGNFFTGQREPEEEWFWQFERFLKLKKAFFECWTSIKTKINMTCVSKQYGIKTKLEQEQRLQLKMLFLLGHDLIIVWGNWLLVWEWGREGAGRKIWWEGAFWGDCSRWAGGGRWINFRLVGGLPPSPSVGTTLISTNNFIIS